MRRWFAALSLTLTTALAQAALVTQELDYSADGVTMKGYLAYDDATDAKRPGVLVVHEWWGHNAYARQRAEQLAELGYTALAVDMYGDGKTAEHPKEAGAFAGAVRKNLELMRSRFDAALTALRAQPTVDGEKTAAIGYCFGGGVVLEMAREGADLDAVASFHGSLASSTAIAPGQIKAEILVANGAEDPMTTAEQIATFKAEMDEAGVPYTFVNYAGAKHSFTNPDADAFGEKFGLPLAYNAEADQDSWARMQALFARVFAK